MIPRLAISCVAVVLARPTGAIEITPAQRCEPEIIFGSYSSGINHRAHRELLATMASVPDGLFSEVSYKRWGKEGEITYCFTRNPAAPAAAIEDFTMFLRGFAARARADDGQTGSVTIRFDR